MAAAAAMVVDGSRGGLERLALGLTQRNWLKDERKQFERRNGTMYSPFDAASSSFLGFPLSFSLFFFSLDGYCF